MTHNSPSGLDDVLERPSAPREKTRNHFVTLVMDPDLSQRETLLRLLGRLGAEVHGVGSPAEAVEAAVRFPYDLVLADCRRPGEDGYALAAELRRREGSKRRTPVAAMAEENAAAPAPELDDFIPKPVRQERLEALLAKWDDPLDTAALERLRQLDGDGPSVVASEAVRLFLEQASSLLADLRRTQDSQTLARAAHTLKGSCAALGLRRMQALSARLEIQARSGAPAESTRGLAEALVREFDRAKQRLKREKEGRDIQ
jgi:two-component system, sensor histidine kinase and response regulator